MTIFYYSRKGGFAVLVNHKREEFVFYRNADDIMKNEEVYDSSDCDIKMQADISVVNLARNLEKNGYKRKGEEEWVL